VVQVSFAQQAWFRSPHGMMHVPSLHVPVLQMLFVQQTWFTSPHATHDICLSPFLSSKTLACT
jgi:hypothetical protein